MKHRNCAVCTDRPISLSSRFKEKLFAIKQHQNEPTCLYNPLEMHGAGLDEFRVGWSRGPTHQLIPVPGATFILAKL